MENDDWKESLRDKQVSLQMAQDLVKRLARMETEINAITSQGKYEINEMADHEDVAQIVSHS